MRLLHIVAGLIGLASGAVALYALKGAKLHRKSGMIFVYAMLFMSSSGAVIAALKPQRLSVIAGVLTFYLVITVTAYAERLGADRTYVIVECVRQTLDSDMAWKRDWAKPTDR